MKPKMYKVSLEIDIEAHTPDEAAKIMAEWLDDPSTWVYNVTDPDSNETFIIDLDAFKEDTEIDIHEGADMIIPYEWISVMDVIDKEIGLDKFQDINYHEINAYLVAYYNQELVDKLTHMGGCFVNGAASKFCITIDKYPNVKFLILHENE